jgi:hypothetical protein
MAIFKRLQEILRSTNPFRHNGGLEPKRRDFGAGRRGREIVVSRAPLSVDRYRIDDNPRDVEETFNRVVSGLMELCDRLSMDARRGLPGRVILREQGSTEDGRSYLFMKPMNEHGWLMEKSAVGWRISRAEKIVGQNLFLRSNEAPWDMATLWSDEKGEGLRRVSSSRVGKDLLSISEYERRLVESLKDLLINGALN